MTDASDNLGAEGPTGARPRVAGERTISPVAGRLGAGWAARSITLVALVVGGGIFVAATWSHHGKALADNDPQPAAQVVPYEGPKSPPAKPAPTLASAPTDPNAPRLAAVPPAAADPQAPGVAPGGGPAAGSPSPAAQKAATLAEAVRRAPILAYSAHGAPAQAAAADGARLSLITSATANGGAATPLDELRRPSTLGQTRAARLPDRDFLIVAGANLPCILQTAIDSSTPGYVTCVIAKDIYSDNGAVVLMEKGTRALGEYHGGVGQGQKRLFVLWDRAVTPTGVAINLASPASDSLGRAGFDGDVDAHFWARFGGALLLSIVDDGVAAAAGGSSRYPNVIQLPNEAASIALQNSIRIPPTLRKPQGAEVSIFVAQDLDFAGVYGLRGR